MPRKTDPSRKPELLGQIVEHLRGRSLATMRRAPERRPAHLAPRLTGRGVPAVEAEAAARGLAAVMSAAQLDAVLSGDVERVPELAATARARFGAVGRP